MNYSTLKNVVIEALSSAHGGSGWTPSPVNDS